MEKEEQILEGYISGQNTGEDNKLRAAEQSGVYDLTNVFYRSLLETKDQLRYLNKNLSDFNNQSSKLQFWLILWTAVIALATLANVWATDHWWPFK